MANNADTLVAMCKLIIEDTPHSEVNVAVEMAEWKARVAQHFKTHDISSLISIVAVAAISEMDSYYRAYAAQKRSARCQS